MKKINFNDLCSALRGRRLPLYALITAAAIVLLAVSAVMLPRLTHTDEEIPEGTLRNPTTTPLSEDDPAITPVDFVPSDSDFCLSLPDSTAGTVYAVPTDSALYLTSSRTVTAESLADTLVITPAAPLSVTASGEGFLVTPMSGAWNADTLYRLSLDGEEGYLAAFQTARIFAVDTVYPAHQSTDVPTDTGIEITFSDTVRNTDLASYITVTPAIDGRFEIYPNGRTVVIIPDEPLDAQTVYTVTVKAGMPSDSGTALTAGRVFGFTTMRHTLSQSEAALNFSVPSELLTSPGKQKALNYSSYLSNRRYDVAPDALTVTASIYRIPSADDLMTMLEEGILARTETLFSDEVTLPTDGLTAVYEGAVETYAEFSGSTYESGWLYLPPMDEGIYLVSLHAERDADGPVEDTVQLLWQVTPMRAYTESVFTDAQSDTLIWTHRTDTGDAAVGAAISALLYEDTLWHEDGKSPAPIRASLVSDADGLAALTDDSGADRAILHISHDGHALVLCTALSADAKTETVRGMLYTDRQVYFANDTVHFHGVLGRTYPDQILPDTLSLNVAGNDTGVTVAVADDGTFIGSFAIEDWIGSRISVTLTDDDGKVSLYRTLSVTQQEKPLYELSVSYDRPYYTLEHPTAVVKMQMSYFDGTPAPGMTLSVYTEQKQQTVITDEAGQATFTYRMPDRAFTTTYPHSDYVDVQLSGYETVSLYVGEQTVYFHSSGVLSSRRVDNDHSIVTLHALDTSRITSPEDVYAKAPYYPEIIEGDGMNATVSVKLEKHYYIKQKSGQTYYDPINKVTVDYYDYTPKTDVIKTYTADVVGGELRLDHIDARGEECSYYYVVSWTDPACGRTYTERIRANRGTRDYSPYDDNTPIYTLEANTDGALPGETVSLSLLYDDEPAALKGIRALYTRTTALDGRCDVSAGNANAYRYSFDEACTLGSTVNVTVFDGEAYITHLSHTAYYDETRGANAALTVQADRDTYKPGETAAITVTSPDLAGGTVLVSIVDEACFALGENIASTTDYFLFASSAWYRGSTRTRVPDILRDNRHSLLSVLRASGLSRYSDDLDVEMEEAPAEDAADKNLAAATGGAAQSDPVYVREQFSNTAAFVQVHLDEHGIGTAEITVPDNITEWRLTAIGFSGTGTSGGADFTSGVRCGIDVSRTVCTLPFFLNVTVPDLILTRDEVAFSARTAGTLRSADPTAAVSYTAVLYDETGAELAVTEATAAANEAAWFSFDALAAGDYSVVVTGRCGDASDGVRSTFRVVETAQIVRAQKTVDPASLSAITPAAYPLTLTFFDATDTLYYETISRLSCYHTRRTDAKAAAYAALMAEEALFGGTNVWYSPANTADKLRQEIADSYWSYLPLLQYGEGDPILTAKILYCAPDLLSAGHKSRLVTEYESLLTQRGISGEKTAAALLALASLDRPVLDRIYNAARYVHGMSDTEVLYLAAAFAAAGDTAAARALWEPLRNEWGQEEAGDAFCIVGTDTEDTIRLTALALLPASAIDADTACAMMRYLQNHTSSVELYSLEQAAFLTHYTPRADAETHLRYRTRTGEEVDVTLKRGQSRTLTLTKSDFASFEILSADEGIAANISYGATPADAMMEEDSTLKLYKEITPYDIENGIYRVTISYEGQSDADRISYALFDTIPAGARFFISESNKYAAWNASGYVCLNNDGGQQMKGTISAWNPTLYDKDTLSGTQPYAFSGSVSYLIRGAVMGEFTAEPALAVNNEYQTYAQSASFTVDIQDGGWEIK